MRKKLKQGIALVMAASMVLQSSGLPAKTVFADEEKAVPVWTGETTEEVLQLIDGGIDLSAYFEGDLVKDITREELVQWKTEGKDINDVVLERARQRSAKPVYDDSAMYNYEERDEDGNIIAYSRLKRYYAAPDSDGKYYLTDCYLPGDKGTVNLSGTSYAGALFNPKTGGTGTGTPWYITLGGDEAMCVSYEGSATAVGKAHNYVQADVNNLKNNPFFQGGSTYPAAEYIRGACYAYERIMGLQELPAYPFHAQDGTLDAGISELSRLAGANLVRYSGREVNQAVLQIIMWRIAQGSFNPDNLTYEHNLATEVFRQMYDDESGYGINYADKIVHFYDFYAKCAKEAASGSYHQKYSAIQIQYWEVQGSNAANWQDFITWNPNPPTVPRKDNFTVTKYGKTFSDRFTYPNATFYIYSDSGCTNKIGEFTTDSTGTGKVNLVEGTYYLKEITAPVGTVKNNNEITLEVKSSTVSSSVTNDDIYNGITFRKTSSVTGDVVPSPGQYALYEYVSGRNTYMKLCNFTFSEHGFTNSAGVEIPDYSYIIAGGTTFTYHDKNGNVAVTTTGSNFSYSPANEGKFKIVEEAAPTGYKVNAAGYTFTMDTTTQGKLTVLPSGVVSDDSYYAGVKIAKYDALSAQKLDGVTFKLQEKVGSTWYDVGPLKYDAEEKVYQTDATERYLIHNAAGNIVAQKTGTAYPLYKTTANNGTYRIVETAKQNENYVNEYVKAFTVAPTEDNYTYEFLAYDGGVGITSASNKGKSISVKIAKYDSITKEVLTSSDLCTLTVYEYNHPMEEWQSVGSLVYNADTDLYEMDASASYLPHKEDGALSTAAIGMVYMPGMIYYTSVNEGDYKIVETVNPSNYLSGMLTGTDEVQVFERQFSINGLVEDGQVIDMTDIADAAQDTGDYLNVVLAKYDSITTEKITDSQAEFTVYEYIDNLSRWLEMGKLKYDAVAKEYKTVNNLTGFVYHDSTGAAVDPETVAGLHYTSANKGKFKVVETGAPEKYLLGTSPYEKEITFGDAVDGIADLTTYNEAAQDTGFRGTVAVKKYDAATSELVKTTNMTATVYEKVGDNWLSMGNLVYDPATKSYTGDSVDFIHHKSDGSVALAVGTALDYETGHIYYSTANKGRFKIVETSAPQFYTLTHSLIPAVYEKEFTLTDNDQRFEFLDVTEAIKNFGISVTVKAAKYDIVTGAEAPYKDAVFTIQEYVDDLNRWMDVATAVYDEGAGNYTTNGQTVTLHKSDGSASFTNTEGKLYYTTQNLGRFKIVETSAPQCYITGSSRYVKEFNITADAVGDIINLTAYVNAAKNLGVYETVSVIKYDRITSEEVEAKDAEFTVYEYIGEQGKWMACGKLSYNDAAGAYTGDGVEFVFHKEDGTVADTAYITDFAPGRLYHTSANKGRFKVVETKAPTNYTNVPLAGETEDIFSKEFTVNENGAENSFKTINSGARNTGEYTNVALLKYDILTKQNVEFKNAEFTVEEYVADEWLPVSKLQADADGVYRTQGTEVTLHNSSKEAVYASDDGRLYYTSANKGKFRVRETKAPTNYKLTRFSKEFNVLDAEELLIDLTDRVDAANDIGIYATVEAAKYDSVTGELVKTGDTEFTVFEKTGEEWIAVGILQYDQEQKKYTSTDVAFTFHMEDGSEIDPAGIEDFTSGRLYYTTANKGRFKVVETDAPENYTEGTFSEEFTVTVNGENISYATNEIGALNKGISVPVKLQKYDVMTEEPAIAKDAVFEVQELIVSEEQWLKVGELQYDEETQLYSTKGMEAAYHNSNGEEVRTETTGMITYTSANEGKFRIVEKTPPTNYTAASTAYTKEFDITTDTVDDNGSPVIDLTGYDDAAHNLGQSGTVKVSKYDSITKEKVLTGDAEFTVYEYIEAMEKWYVTGVLIFKEADKEYGCEGASFIFHDEAGNVIDTDDIPDYEEGNLYYTTANHGSFKVLETKAPANYRIDGFEKMFEIGDDVQIRYNTSATGAYDTGIRSMVELVKADSITDKRIAGAKFTLQEWSEKNKTWLDVGTLTDNGDGTYTTDGMDVSLHTGTGAETVTAAELLYTTQNLGKYRILEAEAPQGYLNDMYISDILTAETDFETIRLTSDDLKATDTPIRVSISKKSVTTGKEITGATLTVKDSDGNVVDTWVTDGTEHMILAIPAGKYTLIEERSAEGYIVAAKVDFEVTETAEIQKVTMVDEEVKGRVILHKTDKADGKPLAGAKFEIRDELGSVVETLVTDENGFARSQPIRFGIYDDNGTYKGSRKYSIVEVAAPDGYEVDPAPHEFTFTYQDDKTPVVETTIELTNSASPPSVKTGDQADMKVILLSLFSLIAVLASATVFRKKED